MDNENTNADASNQDSNQNSNRDIRRHIVNACIHWARIKGYSDSAGFLRGLAISAKGPMSLDDLVQETGYSKSTVSSNMNLLENLGLVKRIVIPGDKRHLYAAIIDPEIIRTNMTDTITKEMQFFCEALNRTGSEILAGRDEGKYLLERIVSLRQSYELGKKTIDILKNQSLK
ncbi:MAG: MarR family transcriptional regulator [Methanothrix sp.]|nr:MAG: MarR family transcriptional regulator [Methanothrix sp.]